MGFQQHPDIQELMLRQQALGEAKDWDAELSAIRKSLNTQFNGPSSIDQQQAERQRTTALEREANDFIRSVERDRTAQRLEQTVPRSSPSVDATRARQAQADQQASQFRRELQQNQSATWEEWNVPEPGTPARSPRVSRPSGGSPPPSPRTGGQPFYPVDDPLNFRTGEPRQAYPPPQSTQSRPSSLPQPVPRGPSGPSMNFPIGAGAAGAAAGAIAGGALGIATGAPPGRAIGGAIGGTAGGIGGAVIGGIAGSFLGGPVGTAIGAQVGGVVGGFIGGAAGSALGGLLDRPSTGSLPAPPPQGSIQPFSGGQVCGVAYGVTFRWTGRNPDTGEESSGIFGLRVFGKIVGAVVGDNGFGTAIISDTSTCGGKVEQIPALGGVNFTSATILSIVRSDGEPDTGGDPPPVLAPPPGNPIGRPQNILRLAPGGLPAGTPNNEGAPHASPSGLPQGGLPRGDSPDWVSGGGLAPGSGNPSAQRPGPLGPGLPETGPPPATKPDPRLNNPDKRQPDSNSGSGGFFNAANPLLLIPVALTQAFAPRPTPTAFRTRHPGLEPDIPPVPDPTSSPCRGNGCGGANLRQSRQNSEQLGALQGQLGGLQSQLTAAGIGADAVGNAAILAKLNALDAKLGPQIAGGGIGNFIKKTWDFLQIDRVLSVLTFITVLHNAYFLSSSLTQTLFSAISNSLAVFGITNAEGQPLEVGSIVSKYTDSFFKSIFGVQEVEGFKAQWKRFNRIYQAASNVISSVQSLVYSVQSILEVLGQNIAKIGNALKAWGSVSDRAYGWMSEASGKPGILGAFDRVRDKTQAIEEITSNIDGVASEVLGARETLTEFEKQTEELQKLQREGLPKPQIENLPIKQANDAAKAVSVAPPITTADLVKPEV